MAAVVVAARLSAAAPGATGGHQARAASCDAAAVGALPLIERPPTSDTNATLVILLTGDGGWAHADEEVARGLLGRGAAVVGLNMRSYLGRRRSPDEVAGAVACVARVYGDTWRRERLMLLGYSRGADLAPFIAARWHADLRAKLNMVALISPGPAANFQFHLIDLIRDVDRPDDQPIAPEIERLRGLRVVCIFGTDERRSGCLGVDSTIVSRYARDGGHRLTGGFEAVVTILERGLRPGG
jgi:type IV secretory pathway VirJ component